MCDHAVAGVLRDEDTARGGFGGAPKFPPSALLEALLRSHERTGDPAPLAAVERTGTAMARGGIYDQLAGGFARYSVDASWVVPHFEKMLYDNALLLRAYAHWARRTGNPLARKVADETARFMIDELGADGMFISSLDADADGEEGLTYVWTPAQLTEVLGEDDGRWAAEVFGVTEAGTFEHGSSVLQLPADPDDPERFDRVRTALLAARSIRPQPGRDDKVVTAWNGWAITALAEASVALGCARIPRRRNADARGRCSTCTSSTAGCAAPASAGGSATAPRSWRTTRRWPPGCSRCTRSPARRSGWTPPPGCSTPRWNTSPTPSGQAGGSTPPTTPSSCWCGRPTRWTARRRRGRRRSPRPCSPRRTWCRAPRADRYASAAAEALSAATPVLVKLPRSGGNWLAVAEAAVRGPIQIAVATDASDSPLLTAARTLAPGGAVVVGGAVNSSELLIDRDRIDGADAAYVCRGRVCDLPVTTAGELASALGARRVAFGACRRPKTTPRPSSDTSSWPRKVAADDIVGLYAEDGTVEDPVGGEVHIGHEAIRGFYSALADVNAEPELFTLRALGNEAAWYWALKVDVGGNRMRIEIISTMTFNDDGKIASMKAYWTPENITPSFGVICRVTPKPEKTANHMAM